ncbi:MAG: hypothetical protein MI924_18205 [Chloroflexales bacterium]|nr:hypothetical protein [Chloroflexales bacterium]
MRMQPARVMLNSVNSYPRIMIADAGFDRPEAHVYQAKEAIKVYCRFDIKDPLYFVIYTIYTNADGTQPSDFQAFVQYWIARLNEPECFGGIMVREPYTPHPDATRDVADNARAGIWKRTDRVNESVEEKKLQCKQVSLSARSLAR